MDKDPHIVDIRRESSSGQTFPDTLSSNPRFQAAGNRAKAVALDFFAGGGFATQALKPYFAIQWANDICPKKAQVYRANHGVHHFHSGSVCDVRGTDLPDADLAWASFPCQDLSLAGLAAGIYAKRSGLVWEWLRVIDEMKRAPSVLVAENVVGLVSTSCGQHYRSLHSALAERGYTVGAVLLDAARWLPQSRPRIFVVAYKGKKPISKKLISPAPTWAQPEVVLKAATGLANWVHWSLPEPAARTLQLRDIVDWEAQHASIEVSAKNIALISPKHKQILDAMPRSKAVAVPGYRRTRDGHQVLELRFDNTAGCLRTPSGGSSRQFLIIKKDAALKSRLLTVREAARLMGAPDSYVIPGSYNDGYKVAGDAVAMPVVAWLAKHLLAPLARSR
jgi:DNA (cytosine-5)-methyltransferase 1